MRVQYQVEHLLTRLFYGPRSRYKPVVTSSGSEHKSEVSHKVISFQTLALITASLPLVGFTFCVLWSLLFNFISSTSTHCGVLNYLPSVSAAIGNYSPQKYVWRLSIALHCAPRYFVALLYYQRFHNSRWLLSLNYLEISALLGLSIISSTENFVIHAHCFLLFIISCCVGTIVHLLQDTLWSQLKVKIFSINTVSWVLALAFYVRHNGYCETGMYTLFAAAEYVFVLSNIYFHFQAYYDFEAMHITISNLDVCDNSKFSV